MNENAPKPKRGVPTCPQWLTGEARKIWRQTIRIVKQMKVLTVADGQALAVYATAFARWRAAEAFIAEHGEAYPLRGKAKRCAPCAGAGELDGGAICVDCGGEGEQPGEIRCFQQFPQVSIARQLMETIRRYQQEFGLTPSARASLEIVPDPEEDEGDADFFATRGAS